MFTPHERALLEEQHRRLSLQAQSAVEPVIRGIRAEMFAQQLNVIDDDAREKAALCTRRAGKTECEQRYGIIEALKHPGSLVRYWSITRQRCKELYWLPLKDVLERHKVTCKANDSELRIFLANRSEIRLVGADKDKEAQKKRGDKTRLEIVGEAQSFGPFLKTLTEDVIDPCLTDLRGTKLESGTPGPLCHGYWFSLTGAKEYETAGRWKSPGRVVDRVREGQGWSCHRWSVLDNPHMQHMREDLPRLKAKRGWDDNHPTYLREWLARWVNDFFSLFYRFNPQLNLHRLTEAQLVGPGWVHVLGWDIGHNDSMAKVVWAFHQTKNLLYEAFSWKLSGLDLGSDAETKSLIDACAAVDRSLHARFNIVAQVADTGGGGKLTVSEFSARHPSLPGYEAAKKTEKPEHVRLMNDDFRAGRILVAEGSEYHGEVSSLQKDPNWPDEKAPREDPKGENHCCDAALYSWRRSYPYLHEPEEEKPPPGTPQAWELEAKELEQRHMEFHERAASREWWDE